MGIERRGNYLQVRLPRKCSRDFYGVDQKRISTKFEDTPTNREKLKHILLVIEADVATGTFDPTLVRYGLPIQSSGNEATPSQPQPPSLIETANQYADYRKVAVAASTFKVKYLCQFLNILEKIKSENPSDIYKYLTTNYCRDTAINCLSKLRDSIDWAIHLGNAPYGERNPFTFMCKAAKDIAPKQRQSKKGLERSEESNLDLDEFDPEELEDTRAFLQEEQNVVIEAFLASQYFYFAPIILFLFLTGFRPGEASELRGSDVYLNPRTQTGKIHLQRAYSPRAKIVGLPKTRKKRWFPITDPQLFDLLLKLKSECVNPDDLIFKTPNGNRINMTTLSQIWGASNYNGQPGIVLQLANQGKIRTFLRLYACRHTFITLQLINLGMDAIVTVAKWAGDKPETLLKYYVDASKDILPACANAFSRPISSLFK